MRKWFLGLLLLIVLGVVAACGNESTESGTDGDKGSEPTGPALQVLSKDNTGEYLADDEGMTLYYFKKDAEGKSNCTDDCLANWPLVKDSGYEVPDGYDKADFGSITRDDNGEEQLTYKGYPLYYFAKDEAKGDVNGEGVKDVWYVGNNKTEFGK
jgi:predicted lipoprotein with Yx(FWY)xxD motif